MTKHKDTGCGINRIEMTLYPSEACTADRSCMFSGNDTPPDYQFCCLYCPVRSGGYVKLLALLNDAEIYQACEKTRFNQQSGRFD